MAGYTKNSDGGYSVNYDDQRFKDVKDEQAQKEGELNQTYDNILDNSDKYYRDQINAIKDYEEKQKKSQQDQTDFALKLIEQQKEQTQKDYTKEQKGAYVDYMKQTKSNAQNMANSGLSNTGYSESSIVSMYNQYQSRVGTARESLNKAVLNYNNSIQQAILANNEKLAEIAFNSLQSQNQLNQQAFEYRNSIILQKEKEMQELNNTYYARYQNVLSQINNEIELQVTLDKIDREYDQWLKEFKEKQRQWDKEYKLQKEELKISKRNADASYKQAMASIQTERAQQNYYNAKAKSELSKNTNPYNNSSSKTKKGNMSSKELEAWKNSIQQVKSIKSTSSNYTKAQENLKKTVDTINKLYEKGKMSKEQGEDLLSLIYS